MLAGLFQISSLDYRGEHSAEVTFDIALESGGRAQLSQRCEADDGERANAARSRRDSTARRYTLCLTLGALAELESGLGANDLVGARRAL